jgi:quinol monooxygenase YgiN
MNPSHEDNPANVTESFDPVVVTMVWEGVGDELLAHLSRYVVISRGEPGCRNIDLLGSATTPGRVVVIEKWGSAAAQRAHFDGPALLSLAEEARRLDAPRPAFDLLDGISAYDVS